MIKTFSKTNKIRLVGLFCSRDYFHEFAHYIDLIIEVTITFSWNKVTTKKLQIVYFVSIKVDRNFPNVIYRLGLFRRKTFL